jgi:hypothetical protein
VSPSSFPQSSTGRFEERRRAFVAAHDDLEEILGGGLRELAHPEVVDDEEWDRGDVGHVGPAGPLQLGIGELIEEHGGFAVEDAVALSRSGPRVSQR